MRLNSSPKGAASQIEIEFTDKPITPFGGMALLMRFFDKLKLKRAPGHALPEERTSPDATAVIDIGLGFLTAVLFGAAGFARVERIRNHRVKTILPTAGSGRPSGIKRAQEKTQAPLTADCERT